MDEHIKNIWRQIRPAHHYAYIDLRENGNTYITLYRNQKQCRTVYNMMIVFQNTQNKHPIAHQWGQYITYLLYIGDKWIK